MPAFVFRTRGRNGRYYYRYQKHRGTARAEKPVPLPDPEVDPLAFAVALRAAQGRSPHDDGTVGALVEAYLGSPDFARLKPATQKDYRWHLDKLVALIGPFQASDVTPEHVRELRNAMEETPTLANHRLAVIRALWSWGLEHNWRLTPIRDVKRLKVKTEGSQPWPQWALDLADECLRPELRRLVAIGRFTGQRLSDCLALRLTDVHGDALRFTQSKTGKRLTIPIHAKLATEIEAARAEGRIYLVSRRDGSPYTPQDYQAMWQREMKKHPQGRLRGAGLSFHGLRKTAVRELALLGCDAVRIAAITGHSLPEVQRYLGEWSQPELARQAMERWERP